MKRIAILTYAIVLGLSFTAVAQHRILGEVKKKLSSLNLTSDVYKSAITALKPALTHDETKNQAETWYLQSKLQYGFYDKCMDSKSIGKKVDVKAMGHALIDGYSAAMTALKLDTIYEVDKSNKPKIDKKTGAPKFKTKYSKEILSRILSHHNDYNIVGGELYNTQDWNGAFDAWEKYCEINNFNLSINNKSIPDSIIGQTRYYQALTKWQNGKNKDAVNYFAQARAHGYTKKESYDYALVCLSAINDEEGINALAHEAYEKFGVSDPQYVRVIINEHINNKKYAEANEMLDKVIALNDSDAEIYNLKGLVIEQQNGIEQALPYYKKCIEINPENAQGQFNVGRYYYNEATQYPETHPRLSGRKLNDKIIPLYKEAMPYMEKAYQLDSENEDAKNALRTIYYRLKEGKKLQQIEK